MTIATKLGDSGQTSLVGGERVSKSDLRVEAYGSVDELNAALGLARSLCRQQQVKQWTEQIQRTLFRVGSILATPPQTQKLTASFTQEDVDWLTGLVHDLESRKGLLSGWSLPGELTESAVYEVARTVCRRAERCVVRLSAAAEPVDANLLAYLNRLSDVIWLFGRLIEKEAGVDARLRRA